MIQSSKTLTILYSVQTTGSLVITANQWHSFFYTHKFDPTTGCTTVNVYIDLVLDITKVLTAGTYMQDDINGLLTIGQEYDGGPVKSDFHSGYIWEAKLYNYAVPLTTYQGEVLGAGKPASAAFPLSVCSLNQYVNSAGNCVSCSTCTTGCVSGASCYVCADPLCAYCTTFNAGSCVSCQNNAAIVGGACTCNGGYYYDSATASCGSCDTSCSSCSAAGPNACDSCKASAQLATGSTGACICSAGYYPSPNPGNCATCDGTCLTCQGFGPAQCNNCKGAATISGGGSVGTCVCPSTHYPSSDSSNCQPCDNTCLTCQGTGTTQCKSCKGAAAISGGGSVGTCICPSTHYPSPDSSNCQPCDNTCLTCQGIGTAQCKTCKGAAAISGGGSVGACICPSTHYPSLDSSNCQPCDITCLTCQGTGSTLCNSCKSVATIGGGAAVGSCTCPTTHYPAPNSSNCQLCDNTCLTCQGAGIAQCKSCKGVAVINGGGSVGTCVCPSTHYPSSDSSNCQPCDNTCLTCQGTGTTQCKSCKGAATISGGGSVGTCTCPSTHYPSPDSSNCQPCDNTCLTCQGTGTTQCKTCKGAAAISGGGSVGVCICPSTHYPSPDSSNCVPCDNTCLTCQGTGSTLCNSCKSVAAISGGAAVGSCDCPSTHYPSPDSSNCQPCDSTCFTCQGAGTAQCKSCISPATISGGSVGTCTCPSTHYPSPDSANCQPCHWTCSTCQGPGPAQCVTCVGAAVGSSGACICPSTYFPSPDVTSCQPCDATCLTCQGLGTAQCNTCRGAATVSGGTVGVCTCPSTHFPSPDASNCAPCHGTCLTCQGGSSFECTSCKSTAQIPSGVVGTCMCPSSYYPSPDSSDCQPCDSTCLTCTGPVQCTGCKGVASLGAGGVCQCPNQYFGSPDAGNCVPCDATCADCQGPASSQCIACFGVAVLSPSPVGSCTCPSTHFPSPNSGNCQPCASTCLSCATATQCLSCKGVALLAAGICSCPATHYPDPDAANCSPCHGTCSSCVGGGASQCSSCFAGAAISGGTTGTCVCASGTFPSPDSSNCSPCDVTCKECQGAGPTQCTACKSVAIISTTAPGPCVCPSAYSPNPSDCVLCDVSCLTCAGGGSDKCASCYPKAFMASPAPATCQCAGGHYPSPLSNNCQPCDTSCASCRGPSASDCTACKGAAIIEAGQTAGRCSCPTAYYASSAGTAVCLQCHETCLQCMQGTNTDCVKCYDGAERQTNGECKCSTGKFPSPTSRTCLSCDSTCAECTSADPTHCVSCFANATVFPASPGSCICNSGFIPSPDSRVCRLPEPATEYFSGKLISKNTTLVLMFSAVLAQELRPENVTLDLMPTLEEIGNFTWHMSPLVACSKYEIGINSTSPVPDNSTAEVTFLDYKKIVSVSSAVLNARSLSTVIHVSANSSTPAPLLSPSVVSTTQTAATAIVITTGIGSVLSSGTSVLWILVNNMQLLSYIPLSHLPLPVTTRSVLSATNSIELLPNPFFFLSDNTGGLPSHAEDYGFDSGLFLYNSGEVVTSLGVLLCWLFVVVALYQIPFLPLRLYTQLKLQEFRWGNFIRFWIEVYLPLAVNSGLQSYVLTNTSDVYIVSALFALLCGTALLLTPALLFRQIKALSTAPKDNTAERSKWKSLTEEFSGLNHIAWSFYPVFCLRRLIYALNQLFLQDFPILQGIVNLSHCALVSLTQFTAYCFKYVTFQQRCMKLLTVTCEVGVMLVFAFTQCFYLDLSELQKMIIERLILTDLVLMAALNLAVMGYLVVLEILKILKRAKALWSQRTKIMTVNFDTRSIAL